MEFSHRQRSNTAQRLEKMDIERKKAAKVKHVKWEHNLNAVTPTDQSELFQRKDFRKKAPVKKGQSLLSEQLEKCPNLPQNSFKDYVKFDGNVCSIGFSHFSVLIYKLISKLFHKNFYVKSFCNKNKNVFRNFFAGTDRHSCKKV